MSVGVRSDPGEAFTDAHHREDTSFFGMWVFIASEVLFFGGLLLAYAVLRFHYHDGFREAGHHLNIFWGTLNTAILLGSSLSIALAELLAHRKGSAYKLCLLGTVALGVLFLAIKALEYYQKAKEGIIPGPDFPMHNFTHGEAAQLFFTLYYAMTGLHATHMILGIVWICGLLAYNRKRPIHKTTMASTALYWHFVDIVWVFLYPLLYLIS